MNLGSRFAARRAPKVMLNAGAGFGNPVLQRWPSPGSNARRRRSATEYQPGQALRQANRQRGPLVAEDCLPFGLWPGWQSRRQAGWQQAGDAGGVGRLRGGQVCACMFRLRTTPPAHDRTRPIVACGQDGRLPVELLGCVDSRVQRGPAAARSPAMGADHQLPNHAGRHHKAGDLPDMTPSTASDVAESKPRPVRSCPVFRFRLTAITIVDVRSVRSMSASTRRTGVRRDARRAGCHDGQTANIE